MTEVEQPSQNGIDPTTEDDSNKARPADIEADMREMERRKRVEAIMSSKLFREELERIVDSQIREGGASGILQQLSDIVGVPAARVGSVFKSSNCVTPINDIRGVESMGYSKGEKILRCKLAATFRLLDLYGWTQGLGAQVTARLNADQELFLVNPFGLLFHEVTASSLNKVDMQGNVVEQGTTNFGINTNQYILHSVVHAARPDIRCAIYIGCNPVVAVSSLKVGVVPLTKDSVVLGEIAIHPYTGSLNEPEEREKLIRSLGPISKVLLLNNHGALCCGETIEEAFYAAYHIVQACETQLKLLPVGLDNLVLIPEESRKAIYDASRRPPDGYEHKTSSSSDNQQQQPDNKERLIHQKPKWRVGGAEFEALMRMLDNAGFRTGYIYRHPLVKSELPKPKNDVEVPPAVSSLGYLLEEEELYRQGIWKKSDLRKGGDRTRWLNSPNVYQKVEVLETGTPDPKKITKWVADGSPTHSTAMRIDTLQFVPPGTNPKEFKKLQQQIKDNRRADKISAGPQSHILEGVTWDEANRIKDATVSSTGDHVVLMGAASKGIIQRGYQHNATVYKAPYAKNPFDSVTDDELNEYKRTVERKHGHDTDTDFSESEALSSLQTSGAQQKSPVKNAPSQSETEDVSEPQVLRIETKQAPKPSQPEVVLSDATNDFLNVERVHSATSKKPPTGRAFNNNNNNHSLQTIIQTGSPNDTIPNSSNQAVADSNSDYSQNTKIDKYLAQAGAYNYNYSDSSSKNALKELSLYKSVDSDCYDFVRLDYVDMNGRRASHDDGIFSATDSIKVFEKFRNPYFDKLYEPSKFYNQDDEISVYDYVETDFSPSAKLNLYDYHVYETLSDCCLLASPSSNNLIYDSVNNFSNVSTFTIEVNNSSQVKYNLPPPPYRTSSHFGFNYPTYIEPDHKHIPLYPSKYIPLKRNESFDECFSSGRFVNMPLSTFNKILKRKAHDSMIRSKGMDFCSPILTEKRIRLSTPTDGSSIETDSDIDTESRPDDFDSNFEENNYENFRSDYQILKNIRNKFLDPIEEEEESESVNKLKMKPFEEQEIVDKARSTHMKSMFIEKITQMNYSNESPNIGFIPLNKAITSDITLNIDDPSLNDEVVTVNTIIEDLDQKMNSLTLEEKKNETIELKDGNEEIIFSRVDTPRKLMRRPERDHRKQEFYDLWEDHISFYGQSKEDDDSESDEMLFFSMGNSFDKKSIDDQNDTAASGVKIVDENYPCFPGKDMQDIALGMARISPTIPENKITNSHSSGDRLLFFHYDHVNDHYLPHQYVDSNENCIPHCDDQNNNNTCINANGSNDIEYVMDNVNRSCNPRFVDDNFRTTVNEQKSLPMTEEYFKLNSIANLSTPKSHHTNSNGEDELNSIEKLILTKIANSDLDRDEGSIFRKIETTIRTKVTPSKLEQKIRDEISKIQSPQVHSSTPTTDNASSETNSFGSMNLSNVKTNGAKSYWTSLSSDDSVKTPPNPNYTSTSSSNEKRNAEHSVPSTRLKQPATKNVSRVHTPRPFSRLQSRINSSSSSQQTSKEEKGKFRVDLRVKSPSKGKKTGKRKRNFITENIMNVSVQRKKQNLGAIFSINPFGGTSTESDTTTNIRLNIQQNLPSEAVYSFQTESVNGSPRLWVSISPPKLKLPTSSAIASKKKITTTGKQKKKPLKLSDDNKKITQNVKSNGQKVTGVGGGGGGVQGEIEKLGKATENLSKYVTKCENGINLYGKQIRKLSANIDEIAELQENIENDRMELRNEMRRSNRNLDNIAYSLSAEDD